MQQPGLDRFNPFPFYSAMRRQQPVVRDPRFGAWNVFRYDDVQRVLTDYQTFSSQSMGGGSISESMIGVDPPRHKQLRGLVSQAFTPRAIERMSERISTIVHILLDSVSKRGQMDVITDLAVDLPVIVIAEMLGVPQSDRVQFKMWSDAVIGNDGRNYGQNIHAMQQHFLAMIATRRSDPRDDLISALLTAQIDGEYLSESQILGTCILLLVAGNETTTNLIGNTVLCLTEQPDTLAQVQSDLRHVPATIEEVLRYRSPIQQMYRVATTDVVLGEQSIRAGDFVGAWIGSANRDEAQFSDADVFDIRRVGQRHLAFGNGIHFCLGAPLARLETKIALTVLLTRFDHIRRIPQTAVPMLESPLVYGLKHLPVTFVA